MFGGAPSLLPVEAKAGWDHWTLHTPTLEDYTKEVQYFWSFNIAWIFSWEYRFYNFLAKIFPLSLIRVYKVKWWNEYNTILYGKENVGYLCKIKNKKFTLRNLDTFAKTKKPLAGLSTPVKRDLPPPLQNQNLKDSHKNNEIFWSCSKMTPLSEKHTYKSLWKMIIQTWIVRQCLQRNPKIVFYRIRKTHMICDKIKTKRTHTGLDLWQK